MVTLMLCVLHRCCENCFLQPEQDHEVHMGSPKSGREAAAAAAIEQATVQRQVRGASSLLISSPLSCDDLY